MTLPVRLRRWWPYAKRLHRLITRALGYLYRLIAPLLGARGVPRRANASSAVTAATEPDAVTLHPGRPEERWRRPATRGVPAGHWLFERIHTTDRPVDGVPTVTIPATFTLDVRGGRLSGDYGATITPSHVLDHETSTYFGVTDWREHPIYLRPTLGSIEHVEGTVLSLTARGTVANYYHFLYDSIARMAVLEESLPGQTIDAIVVPHQLRYQRELLELAGIGGRLIQPRRGHTITADRLLVPSNPNWALQAPPASVEWLRQTLRPTPTSGEDAPRRLYLTRGDKPLTRRYLHEAALVPELERRGFVVVDPGQYTVQQQIDLFAGAEIVLAPHGAALTNITFAPRGVRVIEMFPSSYVHLGLWAIAQAIDADYRYLIAEGPGGPQTPNAGIHDDVSVSPELVLETVDALLA